MYAWKNGMFVALALNTGLQYVKHTSYVGQREFGAKQNLASPIGRTQYRKSRKRSLTLSLAYGQTRRRVSTHKSLASFICSVVDPKIQPEFRSKQCQARLGIVFGCRHKFTTIGIDHSSAYQRKIETIMKVNTSI